MLIRIFAALAFLAGTAGAGATEIYGWNHEIVSPRDAASGQKLERALRRFEQTLAARRGAAASSKPKEIVVVGSKIKENATAVDPSLSDAVGPPCRPRPRVKPIPSRTVVGGFKSPSGMDSETDVVEFREGGPPSSLRGLQGALREFEGTIGPAGPCIRTCRAQESRCLADCRRVLGAKGVKGACVCEHIRARCLVTAAKQGKCSRKGR